MPVNNPEEYAERRARLNADPDYDEALTERREKVAAAKRDGTPEPPTIKRDPKTREIVKSAQTSTEIRLSAAQRVAKAAGMRAQRYPWETIAAELGYKSADTARKTVARYTERLPRGSVEELRRSELEGLDVAERTLAERIRKGDIKAIEAMLKIKANRARLTALYAEGASTAIDAELMVVQTTMHAVRVARMHPDLTVDEILTEVTMHVEVGP